MENRHVWNHLSEDPAPSRRMWLWNSKQLVASKTSRIESFSVGALAFRVCRSSPKKDNIRICNFQSSLSRGLQFYLFRDLIPKFCETSTLRETPLRLLLRLFFFFRSCSSCFDPSAKDMEWSMILRSVGPPFIAKLVPTCLGEFYILLCSDTSN